MNDHKTYHIVRLSIMLSAEHRLALQLIAEDDKESMSAIVRRLILKEARMRALWPPVPESKPAPAAPPPPDPTESQVHP